MNLWAEKCKKCGTKNVCDLGDPYDYTLRDVTGMTCRQCGNTILVDYDLEDFEEYIVMGREISYYWTGG